MDDITIKLIAESGRSREDMIKFALESVGEELRNKAVNLYQNNAMMYEMSLYRPEWEVIFRYKLEGW